MPVERDYDQRRDSIFNGTGLDSFQADNDDSVRMGSVKAVDVSGVSNVKAPEFVSPKSS